MAFKFNPFTGNFDISGTGGGGGGGAFGAIYYFNRSNASSISGYYEMSKNLVIGAGTTLTATGAGTQLVGSFATVLNNPNVTTIPSGNWNFENYVSMNSNGGTPKIYGEIYSRNLAGTETLIATNISNPHTITDGTVNELYLWSIPVPATNILATDRIVVKFYALNLGGRTMTMHFEDANVAQVTTSLPSVDLSAYVLKSGDTMAGKLVAAADDTASKLNIGNAITGTSPTTTTNGDVWITSGNRLAYRSNSTVYNTAQTNLQNTFNQPQAVDVSSATTALRVTQRGAGEALRVEDETTPDATAFVVSNAGKVGIGVTPDASVCLSLDATGVKFNDGTIQTTAAITTTAIRGQVSKMTSGTITIATAGTYQSTGLTATLDATTAVGMTLGTTDLFAVKNTSAATRVLKIYSSMDASSANNEILGIRMAKNGTSIPETECRNNTGSHNFAKLVTNWMITMAPNDEVALFVANHSSTQSISLQRGRVTASFAD